MLPETRECSKCREHKSFAKFSGPLNKQCNTCKNKTRKLNAQRRFSILPTTGDRECRGCHCIKPVSAFPRSRNRSDGYSTRCKSCHHDTYLRSRDKRLRQAEAYRAENAEKILSYKTSPHGRATMLVQSARYRAIRAGVKFDLSVEWARKRLERGLCEATGMRLDMSLNRGPCSPSIDRTIAGGDYTRKNCKITTLQFNTAKMNWGLEAVISFSVAIATKHRLIQ